MAAKTTAAVENKGTQIGIKQNDAAHHNKPRWIELRDCFLTGKKWGIEMPGVRQMRYALKISRCYCVAMKSLRKAATRELRVTADSMIITE